MTGLVLTAAQITAGAETLVDDKFKLSQIDDLVAIFRNYLGGDQTVSTSTIRSTFEALTDDATNNKCAKLAACLNLWSENQFDVSGFAATGASRQGYYDSTAAENFEIFKYAFALFWDLPYSVISRFSGLSRMPSTQGLMERI